MDTNDIGTWVIIGCLSMIVLCGLFVLIYIKIDLFRDNRKKNYMTISNAIYRLEHDSDAADKYKIDGSAIDTEFIPLYMVNLFTPISDDEYMTDIMDGEIIHIYYVQEHIGYGCT